MNDAQMMHMDPYMHNAFWLQDRITITFQLGPKLPTYSFPGLASDEAMPGGNVSANEEMVPMASQEEPSRNIFYPPTFIKTTAIRALNVGQLNDFLVGNSHPSLKPINFTATLRAPGAIPPEDPDEVGKYLFTAKDEQGNFVPLMICFFQFDASGMPSSPAGASSAMASMPGNGNGSEHSDHDHDGNDQHMKDVDPVVRLVNFINENVDKINSENNVPIVSASPTYLVGATPNSYPVGCPVAPPIPLQEDVRCSSSSGLWPITLPELPIELEQTTGDGINVLILDTLPRQEDINRAVEGAEDHNLLLLDVASNVVMHHNHLPHQIDDPNPLQPKTGKDVKGRLSGGFRMADHGLFVAGVVRDIAPNAHVECIRALNDFCAGDGTAFIKALEGVYNRMLEHNPDDGYRQGDLYQKPVVINLSLVVPPDVILAAQGLNHLNKVRDDLLHAIQGLVNLGALFVASAGNEGDARYKPANPTDTRPNALYPAAFAYDGLVPATSMIPVGAVDKQGKPTSYSCYPGALGIATYGGGTPTQFKKDPSGCFTVAENVDAMVGLCTSLSYPALLLEDCQPTYPTPNAHAWAYWSGTSFATPIVSGLAARILEYRLSAGTNTLVPPNVSIPQALTNASTTHQVTWDRLEPDFRSELGPMLLAVQCAAIDEAEDDDEEQVEINIFT